MVAGAATRALTRREGSSPQFVFVTLGVVAAALAAAAVQACWLPHRSPRRRSAVLAASRLTVGLLGAVPFPMPELPCTSCPGYLWYWLTNSGALAAFFNCLATPLPSLRANLALSMVQLAALAWVAGVRCEVLSDQQPPPPGVSLVGADPGRCLLPLAQLLDWPFHLTLPHVMMDAAVAMSPRAACLACTLWVQAVLTLIIPTALLWACSDQGQGASMAVQPRQQAGARASATAAALGQRAPTGGSDGSSGDSDGRRASSAGLDDSSSWLGYWMGEMPALGCFFMAQVLWMVLRAACAYALPSG
ncbi:hypothetical protein ABPG75_005885 [Micractinium tetrahymenae]